MDLCRRLARLEGRIRPAPGPDAPEGAREELERRIDRIRERLLANGHVHEDEDGALCLSDGTRLAELIGHPDPLENQGLHAGFDNLLAEIAALWANDPPG